MSDAKWRERKVCDGLPDPETLPLFINISVTDHHAVCLLTPARPFVLESDDPSDSCLPSRECLPGCSQPALASVCFFFLLFFKKVGDWMAFVCFVFLSSPLTQAQTDHNLVQQDRRREKWVSRKLEQTRPERCWLYWVSGSISLILLGIVAWNSTPLFFSSIFLLRLRDTCVFNFQRIWVCLLICSCQMEKHKSIVCITA